MLTLAQQIPVEITKVSFALPAGESLSACGLTGQYSPDTVLWLTDSGKILLGK